MLYFSRIQYIAILLVCFIAPLFLFGNFVSDETFAKYSFLPQKKITLGLDLQGGAHLAYEANLDEYYEDQLKILKADIRKTLRPSARYAQDLSPDLKNKLGYRHLKMDGLSVSVTIPKADQIEIARQRLESLIQSVQNSKTGMFTKDYVLSAEKNRFTFKMTDAYQSSLADKVISQTIEVMRKRIDAFGTREPNILRQGYKRVILQVPGASDIEQLKNEVGKTAKLSFHMVNMDAQDDGSVPMGHITLPFEDEAEGDARLILREEALLTGDNLVNAGSVLDEYGRPTVSFTFDRKGGSVFARTTQDNVGKLFAIVLDGKIISAPRIQSAILGGSGIITGNFTRQEANNLALLLRAGSLPVNLTIVEERTVGSELGAESVNAGKNALLAGFIAVSVFMLAYYGVVGIFSVVALTVSVLLIFTVLTLLSATLTLPGIAGVVLSIGVAVDANVLINERIREEIRRGHDLIKAVSIGYERAWMTILDSHITGVVSAMIMFILGAGPIRGFAVTLALGVFISLFTSVWVSRLFFAKYIFKYRPKKLKFGLSGT